MRLTFNEIIEAKSSDYFSQEVSSQTLEDEIFNVDWAYNFSEEELEDVILEQYKNAMLRHSDWYNPNLYYHFSEGYGNIMRFKNSFFGYYANDEHEDLMIFSHFMPYSLREGMEALKYILESTKVAVFAVTPYLGEMLSKLGYIKLGEVPQVFAGELCMKQVYSNKPVEAEFAAYMG